MAETKREKLDALGQIQEEMYADIADFIVNNSVIKAIGEDNPDLTRKFWLTFNDNEEIDSIFYHHLKRLGRTAEFEHAGNLVSLFSGTNVINFERIYAYREEDFGFTNSSYDSLERAKKLLIPLIEEEISTQKLICMLCYCETHKKYNEPLFKAFEELLFYTPDKRSTNHLSMAMALKKLDDGRSAVYEAKAKCKKKLSEWYEEFFGDTFNGSIPITRIDYTEAEFCDDFNKHAAQWFHDGLVYNKVKETEVDYNNYTKVIKDGFRGWELAILSNSGKYGGLSDYIINFIDACGFDNIFLFDGQYIFIPKIVYKEMILTLKHMKKQKYFGLNDRWKTIDTKDALRTFGNMYFLYLSTLQILSKLKPDLCVDVKLQIQKSLATPRVPLYLSAYICLVTTENPGDNYIMQAVQGKMDINDFNKKEINAPLRVPNFQRQLPQSDHIAFVNWLHNIMK